TATEPWVSLISIVIATELQPYRVNHSRGARRLSRARGASSCGSMFGVFDAPVIDADQRFDQAVANLRNFAEGEAALVELAVAQPLIDEVADQALQPGGRRVGEGAAGAFDGVGDHEDGGLSCLGPGPRISVRAFRDGRGIGVVIGSPVGLMVEVFDERRSVV